MSTDQPEPDPFRKPPSEPPPSPPPSPPGEDGSPYGGSPYGGAAGAPDPLAGMPPLAPRGKRLLARIVDALIIGIPLFAILTPLMGMDYTTGDDGAQFAVNTGGYWQGLIYTIVYFVYEGLMLTTRGQTLGKMLMKVRVGMLENGAIPAGNPGWLRAAVYSLPTILPCLGSLFWLVNVLFCTWDQPYRQCIHDKAAKTVVVAT
jgi:uncharacterized RDD family membrane protein YckC